MFTLYDRHVIEQTHYKVITITPYHLTVGDNTLNIPKYSFLIFLEGEGILYDDVMPYYFKANQIFHCTNQRTIHVKNEVKGKLYIIHYHPRFANTTHLQQHIFQKSIFNQQTLCLVGETVFLDWITSYKTDCKWKNTLLFLQWLNQISKVSPYYPLAPFMILQTIQNHCYNPPKVQYIADEVNMTVWQLNQFCKTYTGVSTSQYLKQCQLMQTQQLLLTNYKIKEVANVFYYWDEFHFSHAFKQALGMSPKYFISKFTCEVAEKDIIIDNSFHYTSNQFARAIQQESRKYEVMKIMKIPLLVSVLIMLSACNTNVDQVESAVTMHTITDDFDREVSIPVEPKRIVTDQYVDSLLALGVEPIGGKDFQLEMSYLKDKITTAQKLGDPINMEKLIEVKPDLIITAGFSEEAIEQYEKVAPTIVVSWFKDDIYEQTKQLSKFIGKEKEAEQWISAIEEKGEQAQVAIDDIIQPNETVSILMTYEQGPPRIYGAREIGHVFYRLLGLQPTPFIAEKIQADPTYQEFVYDEFSLETLPEYAGDWIIVLDFKENGEDSKGLHEFKDSAIWRNLEAVKQDKVIYIPSEPFFTYAPLALEEGLRQAEQLIKEKKVQ